MKTIKTVMLVCFIVLVGACEANGDPSTCEIAGEIVLSVEEAEGTIRMEGENRIITYFLHGMVDSSWEGVVCNEYFPDFLIGKNTQVRFSGHFRATDNLAKSELAFGDVNDVYLLELTFIEEISGGQ